MTVNDLIEKLKSFPPDHVVIGQYKDTNGSWPITPVEVHKVHGDNKMVVVQCLNVDVPGKEENRAP